MSRRRPPRGLRPDEQDLWRRVAETARPLRAPFAPPEAPPPLPEPETIPPPPAPPEAAPPRGPFRIGELRASTAPLRDLAPDVSDRLAAAPLRMDARTHKRLTRGKLTPEARIDLHGLTLAAAQPALSRFVFAAHADGRRLVLVITGKGRDDDGRGPIPYRAGALRHEVPMWLSRPPLSTLVQQVVPAHGRHGGGGAYYVWLRRNRP